MPFPGVFKRYSTADAMLFRQNTSRIHARLGTIITAVEMSQAFHDIARFERFTDLNLFKYAFNVIQNWQTEALQFYSTVLFFVSSYGRGRWKLPAVLVDYRPLLTALLPRIYAVDWGILWSKIQLLQQT